MPGTGITIVGPAFTIIALVSVLLFRSERLRGYRVEILGISSVVFAALAVGSAADAACLFAMAATGRVFVSAVSASRNRLVLACGLAAIVAEFVLIRQLFPGSAWLPGVELGVTIGISYVMFRIIHLMVDAYGGELPDRIDLPQYVCYLLLYLTFLAGPIQRIQDFTATLSQAAPPRLGWSHFGMVITGYFKFTVIAGLFLAAFDRSIEMSDGAYPALFLAAAFIAFAGYLYASFSGYTDVVRGIGAMAGLSLPENFDRPLASANLLDLWSRWHISLSEWFKLYVFNPLTKALIGWVARPAAVLYLGALGYLVTFSLMGIWHGTSARFALYGLCLGFGVGANKLFETAMVRRLGRRGYAKLSARLWYARTARALATSYFVLALGFFWVPADGAGWAAWIAAAALVGVAMLAIIPIADAVTAAARRIPVDAAGLGRLRCGAELAAVAVYLWIAGGAAPPLLYQYF